MLGIKQRIWLEKINLAQFIRQSRTSSLAGRVYREQLEQGWPLPGLASEVASINIKNINENDVPKWIVRDAVRVHHANEAREEMGKKFENIKNVEIGRTKEYMETKCISDCRLHYRIWTNMVVLKANLKGSYKDGDF